MDAKASLPEKSTNEDQNDLSNISSGNINPDQWVAQYGDTLFRYAMVKLQNRSIAEELVQETFLSALKSRQTFRHESTVSTWLFTILRRRIADHFRSSKIHITSIEAIDEADYNAPRHGHRWKDDPAKIFENKEFWATFRACADKLPEKLAEVHLLREIYQQTSEEIFEVLRISPTNLAMRLHRARNGIRECLELNWFKERK